MDTTLLHDFLLTRANRTPHNFALTYGSQTLSYQVLAQHTLAFSGGLLESGLARGQRVGVYLDKRFETVVACFGTTAAGGAFVPINPLLKSDQVGYILRDCNVRVLITSEERMAGLCGALADCPDLRHVIVVGDLSARSIHASYSVSSWGRCVAPPRD